MNKFVTGVRMKVDLGFISMPGRKIKLKGVKPIGREDWQFEYFWLYGLVEPLSGESFFWEFCHNE